MVMSLLEWYEEPIVKTVNEIQKGDVFTTEYGSWDNIIYVVFDSFKIENKNLDWLVTYGTQISKGGDIFDDNWIGHEVIKNVPKYKVVGRYEF